MLTSLSVATGSAVALLLLSEEMITTNDTETPTPRHLNWREISIRLRRESDVDGDDNVREVNWHCNKANFLSQ